MDYKLPSVNVIDVRLNDLLHEIECLNQELAEVWFQKQILTTIDGISCEDFSHLLTAYASLGQKISVTGGGLLKVKISDVAYQITILTAKCSGWKLRIPALAEISATWYRNGMAYEVIVMHVRLEDIASVCLSSRLIQEGFEDKKTSIMHLGEKSYLYKCNSTRVHN